MKEVQGLGINPFVQTVRGSFVQQIEPAKDAMRVEEVVELFSLAFEPGDKRVKAVATCPACHSEVVRKHHWGKRVIATDVVDPLYQKWFVAVEFDDDGGSNYVDVEGYSE